MDDKTNMIELLLERAVDYSKTSYELMKLRTLGKTSDLVSSFIPRAVVYILFASFLLFFNLGIALWLGEILGETCYGFFVVAAFYGILGIISYFFLRNWLKRIVENYIIKKVYK
ncbi:MAG: hypothetical protein JXJ22_04945 [Bacteroidales bacterium]|nr:hypothetical protein [Bacteroidales bacterium]